MAASETSNFFGKEREASEIKSELLNSYFQVWCPAVLSGQPGKSMDTALYLDLCAGTGYNGDGQPSSPILILRSIYKSTGSRLDLNKSVKTLFSDSDKSVLAHLQDNVESLPYYEELRHKPVLLDEEAEPELLQELLDCDCPTLTFTDPFGGSFSQGIILQLLEKGSDVFMLFTPEGMKAAINKRKPDSWVQEVFGSRLALLKAFQKANRDTDKREGFMLDNFEAVFRDKGYTTFRFRINSPDKKQTSHYLLFATKVALAYSKLKEMLVQYSDFQEDGVPLFGANLRQQQMSLFHEYYEYSIESLLKELSEKAKLYNNQALQQIYEKHHVGTHYIIENYKLAYERLMRLGKVRFINPKTGQAIHKITYTSLVRYK